MSTLGGFRVGPHILVKFEFEYAGFCGERKTGKPGGKPTTNSTRIPCIAPGWNSTRATLALPDRCSISAPQTK